MEQQSDAGEWGLCKQCKWWEIEPSDPIADDTLGFCAEKALRSFRLRIVGNGGCNHHIDGTPVRAAGSSEAPPTAEVKM